MGAAAAESRWKNREAKKGIPAPGVGGDGTANSAWHKPSWGWHQPQLQVKPKFCLCVIPPPPSPFFINSVVFKREQRGCKSEAISQVR